MNLKLTRLTYQRTFNIGPYESEVIGGDVTLEEGQDPTTSLKTFQNWASDMSLGSLGVLKNAPTVAGTKSETTTARETKIVKETTKAETKNAKAEVKSEPVKEEVVEEKKVETPKAEKKVKAPAFTIYNKETDNHRAQLGSILDVMTPGWRANPKAKEAAKAASEVLTKDKENFIDSDGKHLETFMERVRTLMAAYLPDDL